MDSTSLPVLERIAAALERLSPPAPSLAGLDGADAFIWHPALGRLTPVPHVPMSRWGCCRASSASAG